MNPKNRTFRPLSTPLGVLVFAVILGGHRLLQASSVAAKSTGQDTIVAEIPVPILAKVIRDRGMLPAGLAVSVYGPAELEVAVFVWPVSPELIRIPGPPLPSDLRYPEWSEYRADLVSGVVRRCGHDRLADLGDALLIWPELLFDGLTDWIGSGRETIRTWEDYESGSVTGRLMEVQAALRHQRISAVFLEQWVNREQKYLGEFEESRADTYGFQNRTEGANLHELGIEQRKVLLDALRRTYLARYKMQSEEHIPEEAWAFGRWSGLDFAVLPPLIGGLLYFRGLNKRISMGDTALRVCFDPPSELLHRKHDRPVAAALEWTVKGFPVGVIVSAGLHDGRYGMDFVGIGTSIGAARTAVEVQHDLRR